MKRRDYNLMNRVVPEVVPEEAIVEISEIEEPPILEPSIEIREHTIHGIPATEAEYLEHELATTTNERKRAIRDAARLRHRLSK